MKNANLETMQQLKLQGMATAYETIIGLPINQQPDKHEMIATLMDAEARYRQSRRMELFLRLAKLRYRATLHDIDCSEKRNLTKEQILQLADGSYIDRSENVLITELQDAENHIWPVLSATRHAYWVSARCITI